MTCHVATDLVDVGRLALRFEYDAAFEHHKNAVREFEDLIENGMPSRPERELADPFGDTLDRLLTVLRGLLRPLGRGDDLLGLLRRLVRGLVDLADRGLRLLQRGGLLADQRRVARLQVVRARVVHLPEPGHVHRPVAAGDPDSRGRRQSAIHRLGQRCGSDGPIPG